jgi:sarcosine oxidase, subunit beta
LGGGAVGLCSALYLVRRGVHDVTVVDRAHPAAGSSGLSVGVIETQYVEPLQIELRILAMRFFVELERDHGLEIIRTGYLRLAHTAEQADRYAVSVEIQHSLDVSSARIVEGAESRRPRPI